MAAKSSKKSSVECNTVFYASTSLFRVPMPSYKTNTGVLGLHCTVYRGDVLENIAGQPIGYLYEYYFDYDSKFLEQNMKKGVALDIIKKVGVVCKRYNPAWYKYWNTTFIENTVNTYFGRKDEVDTLEFLAHVVTMVQNNDIVSAALEELGYGYVRRNCFAYESVRGGKRGIHYDIIVLQPQKLKIKKVLQITENKINGVIDLTPIVNTLSL